MSTSGFVADALLSRAAPQPHAGGFDVENLLAPVRVAFAPDPLLAPPVVQANAAQEAMPLEFQGAGPTPGTDLQTPTDAAPEPASEGLGSSAPERLAPHPSPDGAGHSGDIQVLLEQRYREGYEEGLAQGVRLTAGGQAEDGAGLLQGTDGVVSQTDSEGGIASRSRDVVLLLESMSRALQPLLLPDDAATRFEPLKRLALHLAMELVRHELSLSPRVVVELVRRSVQALQAGEQAPLTVELHPQDLALMQEALNDPAWGLTPDAPLLQRVNWREDVQLSRGSVRARSDASTVEDLIQHRLASIIQDLRIQSLQWQQDEARIQQGLELGAAPAGDVPTIQSAAVGQTEGQDDSDQPNAEGSDA